MYNFEEKRDSFRKILYKKSKVSLNLKVIKGPLYKNLSINPNNFETIGFQSTHIVKASKILKESHDINSYIILGFTSNAITCGLRETISSYLKEGKVKMIITTAGAIEEDIMKSLGDFYLGKYRTNDEKLYDLGINRSGNILVPNSRYIELEDFLKQYFKPWPKIVYPSIFCERIGFLLNDEESFLFQAAANSVPVYCPALLDGAIGDFFIFNSPEKTIVDCKKDHIESNKKIYPEKHTTLLLLGGSIPKHYAANANIVRGGANNTIYLNTGLEFEGSNAGALPCEAISWGKIKKNSKYIKVNCDFTISFPLILGLAKNINL